MFIVGKFFSKLFDPEKSSPQKIGFQKFGQNLVINS